MDDIPIDDQEPSDVILSGPQVAIKKSMKIALKALEGGHSRAVAASYAGVSYNQLSRWFKKGRTHVTSPLYTWFYHAASRSEGTGEGKFADIVIKEAVEKHNWRAAMFVLQKRYKWNDRPVMDSEIQLEQQKATLEKTKADCVLIEARTKQIEEDGDEIVLDRLREILNEVRAEVKSESDEEAVN